MSKAQVDGRRAIDDAAKREAEAFRPNSRPMMIALGVNGLIAALFLVVPYYRGQKLAEHSLQAFGRFASCAIGGEPETRLGLALPPAERSHFADKVLHGAASWPQQCATSLRAIAPEEAIFLWPSVKRTGADVAAAAGLVERELAALEKARKQGVTRVPERPLLAIGKLRAALTLLARAAGVSDSLDEPAVRFAASDRLAAIEPTRLPIMAAETAVLDLWLRKGGIEALALDVRGLSWLALDDGKIDRTRVKRSSLLRGTVRAPEPYAVFAMPEERCKNDEHRCVRRATGVAPITRDGLFTADQEKPLTPQWLAAHPDGRFDRSVRIDSLHIDVLARTDVSGALELRRFARATAEPADEPSPTAEAATDAGDTQEARAPKPAGAIEAWPLALMQATPFDVSFVPGQSASNVAVARNSGAGVEAVLIDPRAAAASELALGAAAGGKPFVTACRDAQSDAALERAWIAYGSDAELAVVRVETTEGTAAVTPLTRATLAIEGAIHPLDPSHDRVLVRCDGASSATLVLTAKAELVALLCEDARCEQRTISANVETFSGALARSTAGTQLVLALSRQHDPSIAVTTWQLGSEPAALRTLAGCWDPAAGMCGAPALASDGAQVVLVARERGDLRVIESRDAGATWTERSDMAAETTTNLAAPMDQHRMRKGLDK